MTPSRICIDKVVKSFGPTRVLRGVSLAAEEGERLVLVGRSGTGKTTLLRLIAGLDHPDEGTIQIDGHVATKGRRLPMAPHARSVSMVFQDLGLWEHATVETHLSLVLRELPPSLRSQRVEHLLEAMELEPHRQKMPRALSGGERQRLALARALAPEARILLLDEPLSHVDAEMKAHLLALLQRELEARSPTVIYVTHDPREPESLSARFVAMEDVNPA